LQSMNSRIDEKAYRTFAIARAAQDASKDAWFGLFCYNAFMIWDWITVPDNYKILWSIRLTVTSVWLIIAYLHKHPMIQANLRLVYLGLLQLILVSVSLIYFVAFDYSKQVDFFFAFLILPWVMSAYSIRIQDAIMLGFSFVLSFTLVIVAKSSNQDVTVTLLVALYVAFAFGSAAALSSEKYGRRAFIAEQSLQAETNRADNLLVKTFPFEVAKDLKLNHTSQAKRFDDVTVMFCDIVNFTDASAQMSPEELVSFLNQTFSAFDRMTADHGCEKIKTIGDSYMAVCGAPIPANNHAERIIRLALALHEAAANITLGDKPLLLRIGVNSGPVVAGVIGETRFAYDLWGDTVNTASRMESLSPVGAIRITESTKNEIGDAFTLQELPESPVKGKGIMKSWIVIGLKQLSAKESPGSTHVAA
jgi:class 3 adenylate cyclase